MGVGRSSLDTRCPWTWGYETWAPSQTQSVRAPRKVLHDSSDSQTHPLEIPPWRLRATSQSLGFLACKMERMIVPASQTGGDK